MSVIISPMILLGTLGVIFGVVLSIASKVFAVETDPKVDAILKALPGANCGACGYPGCGGLAEAIADGKAPVTSCPVGGAATAEDISEIMGVDAGDMEKMVAVVLCQGDCETAEDKFIYDGIKDCRTESMVHSGGKLCTHGCLGCGTCYDVCDFDAIKIVDGIAVVDKEKCTACNKCVEICPKNIIELIPYTAEYIVKCASTDMGRDVRGYCSKGCIGCQICVKSCPQEAIGFDDLLAKIDYEKCINCSICAGKCPTKAIYPGMTIKEQRELEKEAEKA